MIRICPKRDCTEEVYMHTDNPIFIGEEIKMSVYCPTHDCVGSVNVNIITKRGTYGDY